MDDKETILEQLREGLRNYQEDYHQSDGGYTEPYLKTLDYDYGLDNGISMDVGSITIGSNTSAPYTWTTGINANVAPNIYISPNTWSTLDEIAPGRPSGKITLNGDDADVEVNGRSLMKSIDAIMDRLNMLVPNTEMEEEWDELRAIRDQYEAKLAECREKSRAWKALKQGG